MLANTLPLAIALAAVAAQAAAETHVVEMLNRGEAGPMVFEPAFVAAEPGDTVTFLPTDPSHNAASIEGMLPEGAEPFEGAMNEEVTITVEAEGLYGVQCDPHVPMGMVALIQVGAPTNLEAATAAAADLRGKAEDRMADLLAQAQ